jgi:DNA-binding CsgD family transcriptional regulator
VTRALQSLNSLSPLVLSIGEPTFPSHLLSVLNTVLPVDVITVFLVNRPGQLEYVFSASDRASIYALSQSLSAQYVQGDWKIDPAMSANLGNYRPRPITLTRQAINVLPLGRYRNNWEVMDACDRLSIWGSAGTSEILLHTYRLGGTGLFSQDDIDLLLSVADVSAAAISKHCMMSRERPRPYLQSVSDVIRVIMSWGRKLSPREAEICALIVLARSDKQIAEEVSLRLSSVITYRRRAFSKLAIGSRRDLLHWYWNSIGH